MTAGPVFGADPAAAVVERLKPDLKTHGIETHGIQAVRQPIDGVVDLGAEGPDRYPPVFRPSIHFLADFVDDHMEDGDDGKS
jgi:hypothetical protein